jgi:hypothetical protein
VNWLVGLGAVPLAVLAGILWWAIKAPKPIGLRARRWGFGLMGLSQATVLSLIATSLTLGLVEDFAWWPLLAAVVCVAFAVASALMAILAFRGWTDYM